MGYGSHRYMEQKPTTNKVCGGTPYYNHKLSEKYKPDESYILVPYAYIDDPLRKERHYKL